MRQKRRHLDRAPQARARIVKVSSYALCFILGRFFAQKRVDKWVEIAYNKYATTLFSKLGNNTKFYKSVAKDIIVVGLYLLSCLQIHWSNNCAWTSCSKLTRKVYSIFAVYRKICGILFMSIRLKAKSRLETSFVSKRFILFIRSVYENLLLFGT